MKVNISKKDRRIIEDAIVERVQRCYDLWENAKPFHVDVPRGNPEPNITVTAMLDHIEQTCVQHQTRLDCYPRRARMQVVYAAARRACRSGRLVTSLGCGVGGREARCYEPAEEGAL